MVAAKIPPHDESTEKTLLGCWLVDNSKITDLPDEAFYYTSHRIIAEAIKTVVSEGRAADVQTVFVWIRENNKLDKIQGGAAALAELTNLPFSPNDATGYSEIIKNNWHRRQIIIKLHELIDQAYSYEEIGILCSRLAKLVKDVSIRNKKLRHIKEIAGELLVELEELSQSEDPEPPGISTGFPDLDKYVRLYPGEMTIIAGRPGMGKAQPLDSKIITQHGWTTIGKLRVGDKIAGSDGQFHNVTGIYDRGIRPVYKVIFDDGSFTRCCDEHLWTTKTRNERKQKKEGSVKQLSEIRQTLERVGKGKNHSLPYIKPVNFQATTLLPIHPWVLGVLIGDGCLGKQSIVISNSETDIKEKIKNNLPCGDTVYFVSDGITARIKKSVNGNDKTLTMKAIEKLGLRGHNSYEKFIPPEYLLAGIEERINLLQGLCDSDGYVTEAKTGIEYVTTSERLRDDIVFLVQSLGGRVTWKIKKTHYKKNGKKIKCRDAYRMHISFPDGSITPVSSKKHLAKWKGGKLRVRDRFIDSVIFDGHAECRCIMVDSPDSLYATDNFILTHNTALALDIARLAALRGLNVFIPTLEMTGKRLLKRVLSAMSEISGLKFITAKFAESDWGKLAASFGQIAETNIWIDETPQCSSQHIRTVANQLLSETGSLDLIIVDYVQLMKESGNWVGNRRLEVGEISHNLTALAKELNCHVILVSQLSRTVEARKPPIPVMSDLKETGDLEQDADNIFLLYRAEYYDKAETAPEDRGCAEIHIGKSRNGPTGVVRVAWRGETTSFRSLWRG